MNKMVMRFFFYIWGALVGTFMLVLFLVLFLDPSPPGTIRLNQVQGFIALGLQEAYAKDGRAGVEALLAQNQHLSRNFALSERPNCGQEIRLAELSGGCLVLSPTSQEAKIFGRFFPIAMPIGVGALASLLVAYLLARRFVRPIERVGRGLTALAQGDLSQRISADLTSSEPAIADVGRAFDKAADKLQDLTEGRSRLFHDISHEIRSPLARLQAALAVLRHDPERLETLRLRMEGDISRIDTLLREVLTLARLELGNQTEIHRQKINITDLLERMRRL